MIAAIREERALAFLFAAAIPLYLALRDGAIDLVVRHEAAIALWWALALALAFRVLPRARVGGGGRRALLVAAGVVAWSALALLWTDSVERTSVEIARAIGLVGFPAVVLLGLNRDSWTAAAAGLSVAVLAIPLLALISRLIPELFTEAQLDAAFGGRRLAFPLDYWNAVAAWSAMAVGVGLGWSVHLRSRFLAGLALATVPVAGLTVYLTYSRGGALAAAVAIAAVVALSRSQAIALAHAVAAVSATLAGVLAVRAVPEVANGTGAAGAAWVALAVLAACAVCVALPRWLRRSRLERIRPSRRLVTSVAVVGAIGVVVAAFAIAAGSEGRSLAPGDPVASGDPAARLLSAEGSRGELWGSALDAFASQPVSGIGPGAFDLWWQAGGPDREAVRDAHSLYVEALAELGLPGLILVIGFLGLLGAAALATHRLIAREAGGTRSTEFGAATGLTAAFAAFCAHAAVDWLWEATAVAVLALLAAGIAGAGSARPRRHASGSLWVRAGGVALAIAAGASQVPALTSEQRLRASVSARNAGDSAEALRLADAAIAAQPWAASPYAWRAGLAAESGRFEAARRDADAAIERDPGDPRYLRILSRVEELAEDG